jgi:thioredoxin 2
VSELRCPSCNARNRVSAIPSGVPRCARCKTMLPWLVEADTSSFDSEAAASVPVLVDLWAPWCGPCRIVSPMLDAFAREHAGRVKVVKVNVDDNQQLAIRFDAMSIPTMVVLRDGQVVDRIVGAMPQPTLWSRLEPHLKPPKSP